MNKSIKILADHKFWIYIGVSQFHAFKNPETLTSFTGKTATRKYY